MELDIETSGITTVENWLDSDFVNVIEAIIELKYISNK